MEEKNYKKVMAENIQFYMAQKQKNRMDLCHDLDLRYTTLTDWINGNKYPRIDKIEKMANYFGITKADLVEKREDKKEPTEQMKAALFGGDGEVTEEMWDEVKAYAKYIKERKRSTNA